MAWRGPLPASVKAPPTGAVVMAQQLVASPRIKEWLTRWYDYHHATVKQKGIYWHRLNQFGKQHFGKDLHTVTILHDFVYTVLANKDDSLDNIIRDFLIWSNCME